MRVHQVRLSLIPLLVLEAVLPLLGCGSSGPKPSASGNDAVGGSSCKDEDGDGFGPGCSAGDDCDDGDDTLSVECTCTGISPGCVCEPDAEPVVCELSAQQLAGTAQLCKDGMRYCRDGKWTECIGISIFE